MRILGPVTVVGDYRKLEIGEGSRLNPGVVLNMWERLTIGRDVHVSSRAQLVTATIVPDVVPRIHEGAPITIGDHAWIAAGAVVTSGVTVGARAVVAANSVVTEDVAPDTLVAGSPAKPVRTLDVGEPRPAVAGDGSG